LLFRVAAAACYFAWVVLMNQHPAWARDPQASVLPAATWYGARLSNIDLRISIVECMLA
jgi:hypothetical protein